MIGRETEAECMQLSNLPRAHKETKPGLSNDRAIVKKCVCVCLCV